MENIIKIIGLLGLGGLISSYFTILGQRRNAEQKLKQEYKETRYKCIILLMKALLDFDKYKSSLIKYNYDISDKAELIDLLKDEQLSSMLYASSDFIKSLKKFITNPTKDTLVLTAIEMRKDLWRLRGRINIDDILK